MSLKRISRIIFASFLFLLFAQCGSPAPSANPVVDVNTLDESTATAVDSIFTYTFYDYMNGGSIKESTFFIVVNETEEEVDAMEIRTGKADYDATLCNPDNAIEAEVKNPILRAFTIYPTDELLHDTSYAICITTSAEYFTGGNFEGFTAYFVTELLN